jgi:hypothetical protein
MLIVVLDVRTEMIGDEYDVARCLAAIVHAAAEHNLVLLEHHPNTPRLLDTALRFVPEPSTQGFETIKSIPAVIESGGGDCAHWTAWRLAENWRDELRKYGKRYSNCKVYWRDHCARCNQIVDPKLTWHCPRCGQPLLGNVRREYHGQLRNRDGTVEDTSRLLGM